MENCPFTFHLRIQMVIFRHVLELTAGFYHPDDPYEQINSYNHIYCSYHLVI